MINLKSLNDIHIHIDTVVCTDLDIPLGLGEYVPKKDEVVAVIHPVSKLIQCKIGNGEYPLTQLKSLEF